MANVHMHVGEPQLSSTRQSPLLSLNQSVIRTTLSLCSKKASNKSIAQPTATNAKSTPIRTYFRDFFSKDNDAMARNYASCNGIAISSLQYCAADLTTNYSNMAAAQVWTKTKYWMRQELHFILQELADANKAGLLPSPDMAMFAKQTPAVMRPLRAWLLNHLACHKNLELLARKLTTEAQLKECFMNDMRLRCSSGEDASRDAAVGYFATADQASAWDAMWALMHARFIGFIHKTLIPLEWGTLVYKDDCAAKRKKDRAAAASKKQSEAVDGTAMDCDGSSEHIKGGVPDKRKRKRAACTDDSDEADVVSPESKEEAEGEGEDDIVMILANARCTWLFAILRQLEVLQERGLSRQQQQLERTRLSDTILGKRNTLETKRTAVAPFALKMYHSFPQPSFVPSHIRCDEVLLKAMDRDLYRQDREELDAQSKVHASLGVNLDTDSGGSRELLKPTQTS